MDHEEYNRNFQIEDTYWWHVGRFRIIESFVKRYLQPPAGAKMADLGCGTGATTQWLQKFGPVKAVDASPQALELCKQRGLTDLTQSPLEKMVFADDHFDALFALDILEHIPDDTAAIREIMRVLKPGAKALITVPAYQWLWSEHDEVCHHQRRYTRHELVGKLETAGFKVERQSYCIMFPFFPLLGLIRFRSLFKKDKRVMQAIVPLPRPLNQLLVWGLYAENFLLRFLNFPFGVSVIVVAQKPALAASTQPARAA